MKFAKLIMVTEDNHNKEYIMTQIDDNTFKAEWGRVGTSYQSTTYPMSKWNEKYRNKVGKGYEDISHLVEKVIDSDDKGLPYDYITNKSVRDILNRLYQYTDSYLQATYTVDTTNVSQTMIDDAYEILDKIEKNIYSRDYSVDVVNSLLMKLFKVIPRRMTNVKDNLVSPGASKDMVDEKVRAELDTLKTMADAVALRNKKSQGKKSTKVIKLSEEEQQAKLLTDMGLIVEDVTDEDIKFIKKQLGDSSNLFKKAWKVTNPSTEKRFNDLVSSKDFKGKDVRYFWHGSRNQNWYNIIQTGLTANPKGVKITGKMFGYGIYFAPKAKKSIGYTSLEGSYWASGADKSGFMALFEVAMGNVLDVYDYHSWCSRTNKEEMWKHNKCHTLYAHEGRGFLYNDEVIAYDDDQVNIKYIVELSR